MNLKNENWLENRNYLEQNWGKWTKNVRYDGLILCVKIGDLWKGKGDSKFSFQFSDKHSGFFYVDVKSPLLRYNKSTINNAIKESALKLPIKFCPKCSKKGLVNFPISPRKKVCMKCYSTALQIEELKERDSANKKLKRKVETFKSEGKKYLLELWIHPKSGRDDYCCYFGFEKRPKKNEIEKIAKKKKSMILDDYTISKVK